MKKENEKMSIMMELSKRDREKKLLQSTDYTAQNAHCQVEFALSILVSLLKNGR